MAAADAHWANEPPPLQGAALWIAAVLLAMGNFVVVLDMTIANVSVPTIAGALAVSPDQGTWVITSYSVAEAIMVPLTGWLAARFGALRVFVCGMIGFGACSALCGLAPSLSLLILLRVMQGLCGGPIMPMSQTLLMRVFPPALRGQATGLWAMTTVVAPAIGPILGGWLCDNAGWQWVFYINVPIAAVCGFFAWRTLASHDTPTARGRRVDFGGLALLILFVGALQIMLDQGKDLDWFGSPVIVALAIVAAIGFAAFLIWELTDPEPIVDLRVFRHRGFTGAVLTIGITFGAFFATIVIAPLWLQTNMGYTATWAGLATAPSGAVGVILSPIVPLLMQRFDARALVTFGVGGLGLTALWRTGFASNADFAAVALTFAAQGFAMPFFFVPTTQIALTSVNPSETASAAGLSNFLRTISSAICTALATTWWANAGTRNHSDIAGALNDTGGFATSLGHAGLGTAQALDQLENLTEGQAVMLATDQMFWVMTAAFLIAACVVWLAPKPRIFPGAPIATGH